MRKILISFLILILLALLGGIIIYGVKMGSFNLGYSVRNIIEKNDELDSDIAALQGKIAKDYRTAQIALNSSLTGLQDEKQSYLDAVRYSTEEEMQKANVEERYKLGYIWTEVGLHASKNNCGARVEVGYGTSGISNQYNLTFTITGTYSNISNFIYDIEKDTNLGFRIEEFNMIPYTRAVDGNDADQIKNIENLQATFIIKNITLDPNSLKADGISSSETSGSDQNTTTESGTNTGTQNQNTGS